MLGFGQISDAAICDLGGQVLSQSALATTSPLATNAHLPTKVLLGTTAPLAILVRRVIKSFLASATAAASLVRSFPRTLSATTSPVGLLVKQARKVLLAISAQLTTNYIRNNSMVGAVAGTPGTLPNNWSQTNNGSGAGYSRQIVGTGTENALPYIDFRWFGTPTQANDGPIPFADTAIAAAAGQTWTGSWFLKLVAGSFPSTIDIFTQGQGGGADSSGSTFSGDSTLRRYSQSRTLTDAGTTTVRCGLVFHTVQSVAFDFTVRIYAPQLEPGSVANPVVLTTNAAAPGGAAFVVRQVGKALPALCSATAALVRQAIKAFLATTAPVSSLVRRAGKPLLASATSATLMVRRISALRQVSIAVAALLTKRLSRTFLLSIAILASYTKVRLKAFAAISWVASSLRRSIARRALSSAAVLGTLKRSTGHRILASTAPAARLVHALVRSLQASAAQTTRLVRTIGKPLKARADRAGILVKTISHHGLTLAPTLARLVRRPAKAFLSAIGVLALLRRRAGLPRASSTHPIATLVRRSLLPRVATSATAVRLVRSILVPLVRPVWAFGYAHKGLAAALRAQTAPQARVIKLLRRLVSLSIGVGAILVKRSRPRLPVAVATAAGSLVRRLGVHRLGSAIAIGNLRRTISHGLVIFVHAAGLVAKRFPRSMLAAGTVAAILRRRTAHLARVSISVLALLPKPLHIKNLLAAVRTSTIFAKLLKLIKHPLLFGLFGPPDLKATNAPPQLQADDANPNLTGKIQ